MTARFQAGREGLHRRDRGWRSVRAAPVVVEHVGERSRESVDHQVRPEQCTAGRHDRFRDRREKRWPKHSDRRDGHRYPARRAAARRGIGRLAGAPGAACRVAGSAITCTIPSLPAGSVVRIELDVRVAAGAGSTGRQPDECRLRDGRDNSASWSVAVRTSKPRASRANASGATRLSITKRALVTGTVKPVRVYRYRVVVRNTGQRTAVGVVVCDAPSRKLVFVSAPGATFRKGRACWSVMPVTLMW